LHWLLCNRRRVEDVIARVESGGSPLTPALSRRESEKTGALGMTAEERGVAVGVEGDEHRGAPLTPTLSRRERGRNRATLASSCGESGARVRLTLSLQEREKVL
jgi:hypothetical protein